MTDQVVPSATGRVIAPGFNPSDEELISYLKRKVQGKPMILNAIEVVDVYNHDDPSDLPEQAWLKTKDQECFFFTSLEKYGDRRATNVGYWHHQRGADKEIKQRGDDGEVIGKVKRLVFNRGLPPNSQPTNWIIHEYHLVHNAPLLYKTDAYVLCRLSHSSGSIINASLSHVLANIINEKIQQESHSGNNACLPQCVLNREAPLPLIQYRRKRQIDSFGSDSSQTTHHQDSTIPSVAAMLEECEPEPADTMVVPTSYYTELINDLLKEKQQLLARRERYKLENEALRAEINEELKKRKNSNKENA